MADREWMQYVRSIDQAIDDAERFLIIARNARKFTTTTSYSLGGKETAAIKRSSMDLTRSLAEISKGSE